MVSTCFATEFLVGTSKMPFHLLETTAEHIVCRSAEIIASSTQFILEKLLVDTLENERHVDSSLLIPVIREHNCSGNGKHLNKVPTFIQLSFHYMWLVL